MAVSSLEDLAKSHKGLHVAAGADDLDDDVEAGRRGLAGDAAEGGRDVGRWGRALSFNYGGLVPESGTQELGEAAVFLVNVDVDTAVPCRTD